MPRTWYISTHTHIYDPLDNRYGFFYISSTWDWLHHFSQFLFNVWKKEWFFKFSKLAGLWIFGIVVIHVGIYGSKVAEGFSAFQRRSCSLCSHFHIIIKFSGVITKHRIEVHTKGQGQRSKVKVTEVKPNLAVFRTVTQVWIHIWWWNDAQSLMLLRRGALLFFKVIHQISRSHG